VEGERVGRSGVRRGAYILVRVRRGALAGFSWASVAVGCRGMGVGPL
jgi:hypothetical protein